MSTIPISVFSASRFSRPPCSAKCRRYWPSEYETMTRPSMFDSLKRAMRAKPLPQGPKRVLVVDDEEPVRRFVARALQGAGYEPVLAEDGPAALAAAEKEG